MNTIIEITYNRYTENFIVNEDTLKELSNIIKNDPDYVSHKVIQYGDFDVPAIVEKVDHVGKVMDEDWGRRAISVYRYKVSYFGRSVFIESYWGIGDIRYNAKKIAKGYKRPICKHYLEKGIDY
jgi:hypothetical protein